MDNLTQSARSAQMALVRSRNGRAEMKLRSWAHGLGFRFRVHARDVPGRPDICIKSRRKAVFMHGCFWHRHDCPAGRRLPKSRLEFWQPKLEENRRRDARTVSTLKASGWNVLVVWECEMKDRLGVEAKLRTFLRA